MKSSYVLQGRNFLINPTWGRNYNGWQLINNLFSQQINLNTCSSITLWHWDKFSFSQSIWWRKQWFVGTKKQTLSPPLHTLCVHTEVLWWFRTLKYLYNMWGFSLHLSYYDIVYWNYFSHKNNNTRAQIPQNTAQPLLSVLWLILNLRLTLKIGSQIMVQFRFKSEVRFRITNKHLLFFLNHLIVVINTDPFYESVTQKNTTRFLIQLGSNIIWISFLAFGGIWNLEWRESLCSLAVSDWKQLQIYFSKYFTEGVPWLSVKCNSRVQFVKYFLNQVWR